MALLSGYAKAFEDTISPPHRLFSTACLRFFSEGTRRWRTGALLSVRQQVACVQVRWNLITFAAPRLLCYYESIPDSDLHPLLTSARHHLLNCNSTSKVQLIY